MLAKLRRLDNLRVGAKEQEPRLGVPEVLEAHLQREPAGFVGFPGSGDGPARRYGADRVG